MHVVRADLNPSCLAAIRWSSDAASRLDRSVFDLKSWIFQNFQTVFSPPFQSGKGTFPVNFPFSRASIVTFRQLMARKWWERMVYKRLRLSMLHEMAFYGRCCNLASPFPIHCTFFHADFDTRQDSWYFSLLNEIPIRKLVKAFDSFYFSQDFQSGQLTFPTFTCVIFDAKCRKKISLEKIDDLLRRTMMTSWTRSNQFWW